LALFQNKYRRVVVECVVPANSLFVHEDNQGSSHGPAGNPEGNMIRGSESPVDHGEGRGALGEDVANFVAERLPGGHV
jgi:hypothetical protein